MLGCCPWALPLPLVLLLPFVPLVIILSIPSLPKSVASTLAFLDGPLSPVLNPSVVEHRRASAKDIRRESCPLPFPFPLLSLPPGASSVSPNLCGCHFAYFRFWSSPLTEGLDHRRAEELLERVVDVRRKRSGSCCWNSGGRVLSMREMLVVSCSMVICQVTLEVGGKCRTIRNWFNDRKRSEKKAQSREKGSVFGREEIALSPCHHECCH